MIERPSLHALAVFLAVVEHGTMTAAAEAEGISQPAISAQIKALDRHFGAPLMQRNGRRVEPTETGLLVADYGRRVIRMVDELCRSVAEREGLQAGQLILGASSTVGEQILPELLGRFRRDYPGICLTLNISNSSDAIQAIKERIICIGVVGRTADDPELVFQPVFEDHLEIIAAPDSRFADRKNLAVAELCEETFIFREVGSGTRELALRCLEARGCQPRNIIELGSNEAVKRAVGAGLGLAVLSTHTTRVDHQAKAIATLDCADWDCRRNFWLVHRKDRVLSSAERAFIRLLWEPSA